MSPAPSAEARPAVPAGTAAVAALETDGLRKVYGRKVALESLTLRVERGEVFGFLGPNGAGKTTAMKIVVGLIRPTAGTAATLGRSVGDVAVRARIGFLPEHFRFHDWLTGEEFLDWHGRFSGMSADARRQRIPEVLKLVGLAGRGEGRLRTFSKGMLQRIGIGQAIMNRPDLLLLDEPTSALDPLGRREVRDLIKLLRAEGTAIFLNSHLLSEVELVCDRVAIVDRGRVVRSGPLDDLIRGELEVEVRLDAVTPDLLQAFGRCARVLDAKAARVVLAVVDDDAIPEIARIAVEQGRQLYALVPVHRSLEDVFVDTVEGTAG